MPKHTQTLSARFIIGLVFRLTVIVLCAEVLVMLIFNQLHISDYLSEFQEAIADGSALILLAAWPVIFWVIKPLLAVAQSARQKTEMLAAALEHAGESVIITDANSTILHVNHAFEETTGFTFDEVVGQNPSILKSGRQDNVFYQNMWQSLRKTGEWKGELWNQRKNKELYPETLHIRVINNHDGNPEYYIGTFSDITERLELERVARQNQKMEALGTLVGGVAHNFNNILSGIIGKSYLARRKAESDDMIRHMDDINTLSQNGAKLIQQLLAFAHESRHEMKNVQLNKLFENAISTARIGVPENVQITTDFTNEDLTVYGDAAQLEQVIMNLINNARDAVAESDEKRISIKLVKVTWQECHLHEECNTCNSEVAMLTVEDSGCGIEADALEQIFDPFYTSKEQGKGTGLGLSMSMGTVESHGGSIQVESETGKGTRFRICLPLIAVDAEENQVAQTAIIDAGKTSSCILIIDDDQTIRATLSQVLNSLGYKTLTADNGKKGIAEFEENRSAIACVICDIVLPDMEGMLVIETMRQSGAELPALLITGYDKADVAGKMTEDSRTQLISKPFDVASLSKTVAALLDTGSENSHPDYAI